MASVKIIFRDSHCESNPGTLYFRIIHRRKVRQINTGCRIMRCYWDAHLENVVTPYSTPHKEMLDSVNVTLQLGYSRLQHIVASLEKTGMAYTVDEIVDRYHSRDSVVGFISYARSHIRELMDMGKKRLAEHHYTALKSFSRFYGLEEVTFDNFDDKLMINYETYLTERGLCPNSTSYYMRNLRAIYNRAVELGLTDQNIPFRHVYTGIAKTMKRAVTIDTIKALRNLALRRNSPGELARDIFLFSFYTRGMAIIDVAFLRKSDLQNGILTYRRKKTGQQLSVKWEPQMAALAALHCRNDSEFMFPLIDSGLPDYRKQYINAYNKLNRQLKKLGKMIGLTDALTFHRSRHGWASIARDNNVPLSIICEGMGHDSEKTTRIYLAALDNAMVDKANCDIIGLLDK